MPNNLPLKINIHLRTSDNFLSIQRRTDNGDLVLMKGRRTHDFGQDIITADEITDDQLEVIRGVAPDIADEIEGLRNG